MPWDVRKRGSQWCVVKQGETTPVPGGCHDSREAAKRHQSALYANEPGAASVEGSTVMSVTEGTATAATSTTSWTLPEGFHTIHNQAGEIVGFALDETNGDDTSTPWEGVLAVLGHPTSDKRYLMPGEVEQRELPLPLMVQRATGDGHDGAEVAGRIESIVQIPKKDFGFVDEFHLDDVPDEALVVWATGVLDGSDAAREAQRLIENGAGVSADIPTDRLALIDPETLDEVAEDGVEMADVLSGKYLTGIAGKIAGATVVTVPAFEEASVRLSEDKALVASAFGIRVHKPAELETGMLSPAEYKRMKSFPEDAIVAAAMVLRPPREWLDDPRLPELTPLTITDEGYVYGHLADWDGCHTGFGSVCVPPFRSQSGYAYFNVGEIECDDGQLVPVGKLMFSREPGVGHAPTSPDYGVREASKYYDDSTRVAAFVRAGSDRFGTWLAGVLAPGLSDEDLQMIRANPPSGDWRPIPGKGSELVAAFSVPVPGFPIPRMMVASAAGGLTIITGPLQVELGPKQIQRKMQMLRSRLTDLRVGTDHDGSLARKRRRQRDMGAYLMERAAELLVSEPESEEFADITADQRKKWAKAGIALPDGSFPIPDCSYAEKAIRAQGRAKPGDRDRVRRHIRKRVKSLGCSGDMFDNYK